MAEVKRLADQISTAVRDCPAVAALADGPIATYVPGGVLPGVAIRDAQICVAIIAHYGPSMAQIAEQVRAAVQPVVPGMQIDVAIEDIELADTRSDRP